MKGTVKINSSLKYDLRKNVSKDPFFSFKISKKESFFVLQKYLLKKSLYEEMKIDFQNLISLPETLPTRQHRNLRCGQVVQKKGNFSAKSAVKTKVTVTVSFRILKPFFSSRTMRVINNESLSN